ncbi:MAG: class I SAM-dependent methyltransferase [Chakrabartia sp.]
MDRDVYDRMALHDATHWWYVARRRILAGLIAKRIRPASGARILEVGCGTGHNFDMLGQFGTVDAIEIDDGARALAETRLGRPILVAPLPELTGIADASYDMIALLDVLEHIEDDEASLASLRRKLKPGGKILLTVPANPWMWSAHDRAHHHHRRYTKAGLAKVARKAGLTIEMLSPFNSLLFPVAAAARLVGKLVGKTTSDDQMPVAPVNAMLTRIFGLERHLLGRVPLPAGVSLVAILS